MKPETKETIRLCPKCPNELKEISVPGRIIIFECSEHGKFRAVIIREGQVPNSRKWKATCSESGGTMDYFNLKYCCRKCGNILEV